MMATTKGMLSASMETSAASASELSLAPSAAGGGLDMRSSTVPSGYNARTWRSSPRRKLASAVAKTVIHQIYEVPNGSSAVVEVLFVTAITSNNTDFRLFHTRPGESPTTANAVFYDTSTTGKTVSRYEGPLYLTSGDRIWCSAANSDRITVTLYGVEA
jgi:hypothetical protein